MDDPICRRALAYVDTTGLVNARITSFVPARPEIVAKYGTPGSAEYGEVLIEGNWSESWKAEALSESRPENVPIWRALLEQSVTVRVTCTEENVIHVETPNMDLD